MEEEKAAAYYEELTRKGEGAARFKQGLGYSSSSSSKPPPPPSSSSSTSFLSSFVRASSPSSAAKFEKEAQLHNIQTKLNKSKPIPSATHSHDTDRDLGHRHRRHRSSREDDYQDREESSRRRRRERDGRISSSRRHRSCSSDEDRSHRRGRRSRSRSSSPRPERSERRDGRRVEGRTERNASRETNVDYSLLIPGYDEMTAPERVKAKMKLQLSQTAAKDTVKTIGWERFDFNKDAPLDDEEIEVAEDDAALVKDLGRSFRFSAVEAKREADIKAAHDQAIFGTSAASPPDSSPVSAQAEASIAKENNESARNLMSDKVISMQQGSWRDRASKLHRGSNG